jgi:hypothetical protein
MAMLMIRCPNTGKLLATGFDIPIEAVRSGNVHLENNQVGPCPHCGEMHTWSANDIVDPFDPDPS